jgi:signal transduction histidine kinase
MRYDKKFKQLAVLQEEVTLLQAENERLYSSSESMKEILNNTLHEVRRFSAQLSKFAERLSRETANQPQINQAALSVFYTAGLISSRLAYTDIELNPRALENQTPVRSGIYKKFDKAKRILAEEAKDRRVTVNLIGESRAEIDALPVFELLPFVLIENGIKYSPSNQRVDVCFDQNGIRQVVTVTSVGPSVTAEELPRLFEKGVRGASTLKMPGEGLGLFLAKRVCEYHDIQINAERGALSLYSLNGIDYSEFRVVLQF